LALTKRLVKDQKTEQPKLSNQFFDSSYSSLLANFSVFMSVSNIVEKLDNFVPNTFLIKRQLLGLSTNSTDRIKV